MATASAQAPEPSPAPETTEPPMEAPTRRPNIDVAQQNIKRLTQEIEATELKWLSADGEQFLTLWRPDKSKKALGAIIILHDEGQSVDGPFEINAVRNNMTQHGWATLAIHLPSPKEITVPARSQTTDSDKAMDNKPDPELLSASRISEAIKFLQSQGQYNIVIVGHGIGAARAAKFIFSLPKAKPKRSGKRAKIQRPIRALVLVSARNHIPQTEDDLAKYFDDASLPVLDVYYGDHFLDDIESSERLKAARSASLEHYIQVKILRPTGKDELEENRLTRRIRGFLNAHAKGVEVERKR